MNEAQVEIEFDEGEPRSVINKSFKPQQKPYQEQINKVNFTTSDKRAAIMVDFYNDHIMSWDS